MFSFACRCWSLQGSHLFFISWPANTETARKGESLMAEPHDCRSWGFYEETRSFQKNWVKRSPGETILCAIRNMQGVGKGSPAAYYGFDLFISLGESSELHPGCDCLSRFIRLDQDCRDQGAVLLGTGQTVGHCSCERYSHSMMNVDVIFIHSKRCQKKKHFFFI